MRAKKVSSVRSRRAQKPRRAKRVVHRNRPAREKHAAAVKVSTPVMPIESVPSPQLQPLPSPQPQPIYATVALPMAVTETRPAIDTPPMARAADSETKTYRRVVPWVAVGVTVAAIVIAARQQPSQNADLEAVAVAAPADHVQDVGPQLPESSPLTATMEVTVEGKKPVATKAPPVASPKMLAAAVAAVLPAEPVNVRAADTAVKAPEVAAPPAAEVATKVEEPAVITITGCLALDQDTIRLKDTSGADAPKSRSWRSGFLKKRPAAVELVDASHALALTSYAGQRVAATGTLMERTMQVRSVHRVTASCN